MGHACALAAPHLGGLPELPADGPARAHAWADLHRVFVARAEAWPARLRADAAGHVAVKALEVVEGHARRALAIRANPPTYKGIVSDLAGALQTSWGLSEELVIEAADDLAKLGAEAAGGGAWKAKGTARLNKLQADLAAAGKAVTVGPMADTFTRYTAAAFLLGQTETTAPLGWEASFSLADQDAITGLADSGLFWIGEHYGDALDRDRLLGEVARMVVRGQGRIKGGELLRAAFGAEFHRSDVYWQGLSATVATRARSFGALSGMEATGALTYEYVNPVDERTSDVCRALDGTRFTVKGGIELRDRLIGANAPADPEGWKAIAPWPKVRDLQAPGGGLLSPGELQAKGIAWPPLHFHCRSTIDVDTWGDFPAADLEALGDPYQVVEEAGPKPKPAAAAKPPPKPKPPPVPRHQVILHQKTGSAQGSNDGGFYTGQDGIRRYVKFYSDPTQAAGEHLANQLYRDLGLPAARSELFRLEDGRVAYASEILDNLGTLGDAFRVLPAAERKRLAERALDGFAADVLTANWDAAGLTADNMIHLADGSIIRIDNGGAMLSRAQGARKATAHLEPMAEWWMFFDGSNPGYSRLAAEAGITRAQEIPSLLDQIERIQALRPKRGGWAKYLEKVQGLDGLDDADRAAMAALLEDRTIKLAQKADNLRAIRRLDEIEAELAPELGDRYAAARWGNATLRPARANLSAPEKDALYKYTGGDYSAINRNLRGGGAPTAADKQRDAAIKRSKLPRDLVLYRGVNYCDPLTALVKDGAKSEGNTNTDLAFGSSSIFADVARNFASSGSQSIVFRLLARKGLSGAWVEDFTQVGGELEVINPRNTTIRVLASRFNAAANRWEVDAEIIPTPGS